VDFFLIFLFNFGVSKIWKQIESNLNENRNMIFIGFHYNF